MRSFAFYGIFRDDATRRRIFGLDGYKVVSDTVAVPGWNVDYHYGVARILPSRYGQLQLSLCTLTDSAEEWADEIEGDLLMLESEDSPYNNLSVPYFGSPKHMFLGHSHREEGNGRVPIQQNVHH